MSEESKFSLPASVYAVLRAMNNSNLDLPADELAKRAFPSAPADI